MRTTRWGVFLKALGTTSFVVLLADGSTFVVELGFDGQEEEAVRLRDQIRSELLNLA
jgi:hypothetical protein